MKKRGLSLELVIAILTLVVLIPQAIDAWRRLTQKDTAP